MFALLLCMFVLLVFSTYILLGLGTVVYHHSYLSKPAALNIHGWEYRLYHIICLYPILAVMGIYIADEFFVADTVVNTIIETRNMMYFCTAHFILSILAISVSRMLRRQHKAYNILTVLNVLAGCCYMYADVFAIANLLNA